MKEPSFFCHSKIHQLIICLDYHKSKVKKPLICWLLKGILEHNKGLKVNHTSKLIKSSGITSKLQASDQTWRNKERISFPIQCSGSIIWKWILAKKNVPTFFLSFPEIQQCKQLFKLACKGKSVQKKNKKISKSPCGFAALLIPHLQCLNEDHKAYGCTSLPKTGKQTGKSFFKKLILNLSIEKA